MSNSRSTVVVVGGGIIGIACAHYLTEAGYQVSVIDRAEIGGACSHANCGMVCPSHILPLTEPGAVAEGMRSLFNPSAAFRIKPQLRFSLYQWMLNFALRCNSKDMLYAGHQLQSILEFSMSEYRDLFSTDALAAEWKENGLLYVLQSQKGLDEFAANNALISDNYGVSAQFIAGDELHSFDPALKQGLAGAYFYDDDASIRPDKLISSWRAALEARGVEFKEFCQLEDLQTLGNNIRAINTSKGDFEADHFVFAVGAWSSLLQKLLGCKLPVEPGKGYSLTLKQSQHDSDSQQGSGLSPLHPMLFPEHRVGVTPFNDSIRLGSMMEFAGFDNSIPERRMDQLVSSATPYLNIDSNAAVEEKWSGWRPMTWDSLPIIDRVPGLSNGLLATGHNMLGITLAPATGRLITELVEEKPTHIAAEAFSAKRF